MSSTNFATTNNAPRHMRRLALCAASALSVILGACAAQQEVTVQRESTQVFSPTTLVQVLQQLPKHHYVRIAVLDAQAQPGTPIAQVLAQLQAKAGALGANAIVVENFSTTTGATLQYDPSGGQFTTTPSLVEPHLRAIAVRIESTTGLEH